MIKPFNYPTSIIGKIYQIWLMDEYASIRFMLVWVITMRFPNFKLRIARVSDYSILAHYEQNNEANIMDDDDDKKQWQEVIIGNHNVLQFHVRTCKSY